MDVPEDAEIGTDGAGLALLAILGTDVHLLEVGRIPYADELYAEAINQAMLERLRRIDAAGGETETGVIIVTYQGYISGIPSELVSIGVEIHLAHLAGLAFVLSFQAAIASVVFFDILSS